MGFSQGLEVGVKGFRAWGLACGVRGFRGFIGAFMSVMVLFESP